jgi:hypothetical protein
VSVLIEEVIRSRIERKIRSIDWPSIEDGVVRMSQQFEDGGMPIEIITSRTVSVLRKALERSFD